MENGRIVSPDCVPIHSSEIQKSLSLQYHPLLPTFSFLLCSSSWKLKIRVAASTPTFSFFVSSTAFHSNSCFIISYDMKLTSYMNCNIYCSHWKKYIHFCSIHVFILYSLFCYHFCFPLQFPFQYFLRNTVI